MWILYAVLSAVFAGITAILAKVGIKNVESNLATALRTVVVLLFSWLMVLITGGQKSIGSISGHTLLFLILSGIATGASWLCYFKALQIGDVNKVTPIDKSSTVLTMLLAFFLLGEPIGPLKLICMVLIGGGTYMMIARKKPAREKQIIKVKQNIQEECSGKGNDKNVINGAGKNMTQEKAQEKTWRNECQLTSGKKSWLVYASFSAVFASLTAILGKIGIQGVDSNLGTAIRTGVVLVMAWLIVFLTGRQKEIKRIDRKSHLFLALSGITTGLSWLCYYRALQEGYASVVVPIDKLSILITVFFSAAILKEKLSAMAAAGLVLITAGTLLLLL